MAIEAVISSLSNQALGKAAIQSERAVQAPAQGASFKETMAQMDNGAEFAKNLGIGSPQPLDPMNQVMSMSAEGLDLTRPSDVVGIQPPEASQRVLDLLGDVNKGHMQMDGLVNDILYSGKKFSNQELLVVQAHVFHFAQMTELTVKVAEQSVSSVKTVLNTQVQ